MDITAPADFVPATHRPRADGWTPERQRGFIEALSELGSVRAAANHVGLSPSSAYRLRYHPEAAAFRRAWQAALDVSIDRLTDIAMERARDGEVIPIYYRGEAVGERIVHNDKLLLYLLDRRNRHQYDRFTERSHVSLQSLRSPDDVFGKALVDLDAAVPPSADPEKSVSV